MVDYTDELFYGKQFSPLDGGSVIPLVKKMQELKALEDEHRGKLKARPRTVPCLERRGRMAGRS